MSRRELQLAVTGLLCLVFLVTLGAIGGLKNQAEAGGWPRGGLAGSGGGGSVSLTSTQVAYGDGSNAVTGEAAFAYDAANNRLTVDAVRGANGSAAQATYGFTNQASTGMRLGAVGLLTLQVAATDAMYLSATTIVPNLPMEGPTGSAANTTYGFGSDTNTGMYRIGADNLGLAAGGLKAQLSTTDLATEAGIYIKNGAHGATAPAAGDCNEDSERHRTYLDHTISPRRLYVCTGATNGWDHIALTD